MDDSDDPTTSAERSAALAAFSAWLVRERELRGVSRPDVLRATRLAPAVVDALEGGDPAPLPPRAYVMNYLRAYAGAVGLDADDVVLRYEEAAGPDDAEGGGSQRRAAPWVVGAVLVLAAAGAAVWAWGRW